MEYNRWQVSEDHKPISIYNFFIYDLLIIIVGMRIVNLLVMTGMCHILSNRFVGALQRDASAYGFHKKFVTLISNGEISLFFTGVEF